MSVLYCFGTNFRIVGLKNIEKLFLNRRELKMFYTYLKSKNMEGVVVLSTCNRFEVYWTKKTQYKDRLLKLISEFKNEINEIVSNFYFFEGQSAFKHLMFVILGFDSMLSVEEDIVAQVKEGYTLSHSILTLNKPLHLIFQNALYFSRYLKNKYDFAQFRYSLTDCLKKIILKIFAKIENKNMLVIGTGIIAKNIINKFYGKVAQIYVSSRHPERVNNMIAEINKKVEILPDLTNLDKFDIILGTTSTHSHLINKHQLESSKKDKIVIFDLGVPRNICPEVAELSNVFLFSLEDIYNFHQSIFTQKQEEFEYFKEKIENEIEEMWGKIILDTEPIDWLNLKEVIKNEIRENLNNHIEKEVNESVVNKLSHTILKNIKKHLAEMNSIVHRERILE
ncbi:MAG: NAD(P)-binding domain-containing protein [Planctomycetota bacterium]